VFLFASIGHRASRNVPSETFLKLVYTLIAVAGVANIFRALV
jgi:uncharacterized membrane protein YfcA